MREQDEKLDELQTQVTEAILAAERFPEKNTKEARALYSKVSLIEEQIADLLPEENAGGKVARRGAVRAAVDAGEMQRALYLATSFQIAGNDPVLAAQLKNLVLNP